MFAFVLATIVAAAGQPVSAAACPASQTRVLLTSEPIAPDNIHPTNRRVQLLLDVGSEGELRRSAITESSGDAVFDAAALDAAKRFRFAPHTQDCISTSSVVPEEFNVPLISLVTPGARRRTGPGDDPDARRRPRVAICGAPFVQLTGLDVPDLRQAPPGTVARSMSGSMPARNVTSAKLAHPAETQEHDRRGSRPRRASATVRLHVAAGLRAASRQRIGSNSPTIS